MSAGGRSSGAGAGFGRLLHRLRLGHRLNAEATATQVDPHTRAWLDLTSE